METFGDSWPLVSKMPLPLLEGHMVLYRDWSQQLLLVYVQEHLPRGRENLLTPSPRTKHNPRGLYNKLASSPR